MTQEGGELVVSKRWLAGIIASCIVLMFGYIIGGVLSDRTDIIARAEEANKKADSNLKVIELNKLENNKCIEDIKEDIGDIKFEITTIKEQAAVDHDSVTRTELMLEILLKANNITPPKKEN